MKNPYFLSKLWNFQFQSSQIRNGFFPGKLRCGSVRKPGGELGGKKDLWISLWEYEFLYVFFVKEEGFGEIIYITDLLLGLFLVKLLAFFWILSRGILILKVWYLVTIGLRSLSPAWQLRILIFSNRGFGGTLVSCNTKAIRERK